MPHTDLTPTISFLGDLSLNNNKPWFDAHRAEYEHAREAFSALIDQLIDSLRETHQLGGLRAKECLERIYRDIRFSRDKSPYRTNMAAYITPGGRKSNRLGCYISLGPGDASMAAAGFYMPTPQQLASFRRAVDQHPIRLLQVLEETDFTLQFGGIEGERLKTAPQGYDRSHPHLDLLQLKQITVIHHYPAGAVLQPDFAQELLAACRAMKPFLEYLEALPD